MWFTKPIALRLCLALLMVGVCSCVPRPLPGPVAGITLQPGRYLEGYYCAPGFEPAKMAYTLEPFAVEGTQGISPDAFRDLLQAQFIQAWAANGLKLNSSPGACRISGTVSQVRVEGIHFRFLTGKISARLEVSGAITKEGRTLFAFCDLVRVDSPVNLGPPPPKERELLLQQAVRTFLDHLLTELLLQRPGDLEG